MSKSYILDACALIALITDEVGANIVDDIINLSNTNTVDVSINKLNLLEVYYGIYKAHGKVTADNILAGIKCLPIKFIDTLAETVFQEAGRFKATYKISLADSIVLAEASVSGRYLMTSDHHEFDIIERSESKIKFCWIR
jgi:PIN domain nuclease of toxin-antitoxin system